MYNRGAANQPQEDGDVVANQPAQQEDIVQGKGIVARNVFRLVRFIK